jgi:hypothetical protein
MKCKHCPVALPCMQGTFHSAIVMRLCPQCGRLELLVQEPRSLHFVCEKRNLDVLQFQYRAAPEVRRGVQLVDPVDGGPLLVSGCTMCDPEDRRVLPYRIKLHEDLDSRKVTFTDPAITEMMAKQTVAIFEAVGQAGGNLIRERLREESELRKIIVPTGDTP